MLVMKMDVFTGVVLLDEKSRVYLIKEDDKHKISLNRWNLPGGSVDAGEGIIKSAERETLEETGYQAEIKSILGCYLGSKGGKSWLYIVLKAVLKDGKRTPPTDVSVKEGRWFDKEEFLGMNDLLTVHSDMKLVYQIALEDKGLGLESVKFVNYDGK